MKPKVYVTRLLPKPAMDQIYSFCDAEVWGEELPPPRSSLAESQGR